MTDILSSPLSDEDRKHHSKEADELDFLCRKLSDVRVRHDDLRLSDLSLEQFEQINRDIHSLDFQTLRDAVIKFRKILAHEDIQPYLERILCTVPHFVKLLDGVPELQFECAWVLTNIAAGNSKHTAQVVRAGAIEKLVELLSHSAFKEIKEQAIWCLGNIAGDCADLRRAVLNGGAVEPLVKLIESEMNEFLQATSFVAEIPTNFQTQKQDKFNISTLRIALWAMSNFCRGTGCSSVDAQMLDIALPILNQVITCCLPGTPHADDEILMDTCWALSRTLRGIHEGLNRIIVPVEVAEKFQWLICHENAEVQIPALRCLINIVSGSDAQTQVVIDAKLLGSLHSLLLRPRNETVKKEACLIISNITAGNPNQVQAVIDAGIFPTLVEILWNGEFRTKREACWAIGNALLNRNHEQVKWLMSQHVLTPLLHILLLRIEDERVILKALEAIRNILTTGDELLNSVDSLMANLNGMRLADSAFSSMTEIYTENPYKPHLKETITCQATNCTCKRVSGLEAIEKYRSFNRGSALQLSQEVRRLSIDILSRF